MAEEHRRWAMTRSPEYAMSCSSDFAIRTAGNVLRRQRQIECHRHEVGEWFFAIDAKWRG